MVEKQRKMKNGSRILIDALLKQKVEMIFGYPGGAVLPLYDALYDGDIPHILTRHEQGAVHAAEGYAKATGKPGVVIVTSGPGATNAITGIADAMSDSIPMVVFTGQVVTDGIGKDAFQEADVIGLTMPITKNNYQVRETKELPRIIEEAFHIATTGRKGPVVIDLPKDMTIMEADADIEVKLNLPSYQPTVKPNKLQVKKLMEALTVAKKPLVLVGAGVLHADAGKELVEFINQYQVPTLSSLLGLGAVPTDNELFLGMGGMHGSFAANMALTDCDFLINIGSRFDDRLASAPKEFAPNAIIAHVDIDPAEIGKTIDTQIPIVADAKETLKEMLKFDINCADSTEWKKLNLSRKKRHPFKYDKEQKAEIKPQKVIEFIGELTNGEAIVATDVGQHQMWAAQFYPFKNEKQLVTSGGLGTMGYGVPAAIGAKLGCPDKEVVLFVGDGGFQMTNQELAILNEYNIPIKIVILNNQSLGMVRQWQESFFNGRRSESVFTSQPDFVKMAEAYHIRGIRIDDPETVEAELTEAFKETGPLLIEVMVSPTEHVLPMVPAGKANYQMLGVD
ncbi:acetolactate synthase, large subunit, biosynthetic type [Enterococcus haemoperoxidus ATCC BAA-382]|uniref:Acetolactate synthase n=1 Tax=Enterococcus haemoperoxidus ATCC BAA-382 TaxID=1158608 RepID=S0M1Q2_9ENTE|nr:biosynthetic-type acetolactate synthase large subunit [Enterococcus haemoperoxidus]EOH99325.1 acetolactate synthase, large subunit, biosynthetic type [Enterococcus haemoperoxidus ATCC BAA-382]EOT62934.1 acetolactate synthase, large subunit, biosynthetic type [Enterococcus haemoperoxidus ATCC BAA-382]OJG54708.1 acetolactate synthase, large subunit, biosynthetic type [Enterococcus haemoperoxidus]